MVGRALALVVALVVAASWGCGAGLGARCDRDTPCRPGLHCHPRDPGQGVTPAPGEPVHGPSDDGTCREGYPVQPA